MSEALFCCLCGFESANHADKKRRFFTARQCSDYTANWHLYVVRVPSAGLFGEVRIYVRFVLPQCCTTTLGKMVQKDAFAILATLCERSQRDRHVMLSHFGSSHTGLTQKLPLPQDSGICLVQRTPRLLENSREHDLTSCSGTI